MQDTQKQKVDGRKKNPGRPPLKVPKQRLQISLQEDLLEVLEELAEEGMISRNVMASNILARYLIEKAQEKTLARINSKQTRTRKPKKKNDHTTRIHQTRKENIISSEEKVA